MLLTKALFGFAFTTPALATATVEPWPCPVLAVPGLLETEKDMIDAAWRGLGEGVGWVWSRCCGLIQS